MSQTQAPLAPVSQWTDQQISDMYNKLLETANEKRVAKVKTKWNPSEFQIASAYAVRVAQNSDLKEFGEFLRTGTPVHPVKMTPAEMELIQGGSRVTDWIIAVGTAAAAAGAACCS
jgi:hypothetical protein